MARNGASAATAEQAQGVRVDVKVGKLDPRLKLAPCQHIDAYLPPGLPVWGATRMGLRCTQGAKAVERVDPDPGQRLRAGHGASRRRWPPAPCSTPASWPRPRWTSRPRPARPWPTRCWPSAARWAAASAAGATLRQTDLKARQFFAAGETVRVTALGPGWQVVTEGQAVGAGIEGQNVRVRTEGGPPAERPSDRAIARWR